MAMSLLVHFEVCSFDSGSSCVFVVVVPMDEEYGVMCVLFIYFCFERCFKNTGKNRRREVKHHYII